MEYLQRFSKWIARKCDVIRGDSGDKIKKLDCPRQDHPRKYKDKAILTKVKEGVSIQGSVVRESHPAAAFIDQILRVNIKTIEELHCARILEDFGNLCARRDEL